MAESKVAGRYARSLYQMAAETNTTEQVLADMESYLKTVKSSRELAAAINSPIIDSGKKLEILKAVFESGFQKITNLFVNLIVAKGREKELTQIAEAYIHEYKRQLGIKEGTLISATALSDDNKAALYQQAEKIAGGKVAITEKIDPSLIGGYILRINDVQLDQSVKTRLGKLKETLLDDSYISKI